jgi:UPF0716 family protein affecting phage T7 exclusion
MIKYIILAFLVAEIFLSSAFYQEFGFLWLCFAYIASFIFGMGLVRNQMAWQMRQVKSKVNKMAQAVGERAEGVEGNSAGGSAFEAGSSSTLETAGQMLGSTVTMIAGVLFMVPGLASDVLGVLLLLPGSKSFWSRRLKNKMSASGQAMPFKNMGFVFKSFDMNSAENFADTMKEAFAKNSQFQFGGEAHDDKLSNAKRYERDITPGVIDITPLKSESTPVDSATAKGSKPKT